MSNERMTDEEEFEGIVIVGGGIAGLATALALHRFGVKSLVLERAESLRTTGAALTLLTNAWRALDYLGVGDSIRTQHPQLERGKVTSMSEGITTTREISYIGSGKCGNHEVRCVQRSVLLGTLAKELPLGTIRFNSKVVSIQQSENSSITSIQLRDGAIIEAKVLIGCDGVNSLVAEWLGLQAATHSGRSSIRGLARFPEGHKFESATKLYWGENFRAGFVPCNDKDIYWFTTQNSHPQDSAIAHDPQRILEFAMERLGGFPESVTDIVKRSQMDTLTLAQLSLRWPWAVLFGKLCKGNVCVVGDAMHPMTPDLGQGGGATLEDAVVLGRCLGKAMIDMNGLKDNRKIEEALNKFVTERRWRAFTLISGAYLTGFMQQGSGGVVMRFMRDKLLGRKLSDNLLNQADFDCGELGAN